MQNPCNIHNKIKGKKDDFSLDGYYEKKKEKNAGVPQRTLNESSIRKNEQGYTTQSVPEESPKS